MLIDGVIDFHCGEKRDNDVYVFREFTYERSHCICSLSQFDSCDLEKYWMIALLLSEQPKTRETGALTTSPAWSNFPLIPMLLQVIFIKLRGISWTPIIALPHLYHLWNDIVLRLSIRLRFHIKARTNLWNLHLCNLPPSL